MADFWNSIKKLFQSAEESSSTQPVIHEIIERSVADQQAYDKWKVTLTARRLLDWIKNQYAAYISPSERTDQAVAFLNTPSSKGFVIHFHQTEYRKAEILHLFDLLKEKVLNMGYRSYVSDTRTYNRPQWVETIQRHYLKPPINYQKTEEEKFKQGYGNIKIELELRDDKIQNLRFSATTYTDRLYEDAGAFEDLIWRMLG